MTEPKREARGLTVIELMVVVGVVGVLAALAAPSMRELFAMQRVKSVSAELVTDLQYARSEAVRRNRNVLIRFRTNDNCYTIFVPAAAVVDCNCGPSRTPGVNVCHSSQEEIKTVRIPVTYGISLAASSSAGQQVVRFEGRAGTIPDDLFGVTVSSNLRGQLRTTLNTAGRPSVCSPDGSISGVPTC